jgi:TolA-binding protein
VRKQREMSLDLELQEIVLSRMKRMVRRRRRMNERMRRLRRKDEKNESQHESVEDQEKQLERPQPTTTKKPATKSLRKKRHRTRVLLFVS